MVLHSVNRLVFSSSAAVYGQPKELPVTESAPVSPMNPYGESKLMFERMLCWYSCAYGLNTISLRYFNVAGAGRRTGAVRYPETNLIPTIIQVAAGEQDYLPVFGTDYDTPDGTCIRDYIHVRDVAGAHVLALNCLGENMESKVYNLGSGKGYSVMEVVQVARKVTGAAIPLRIFPRRPGDPPRLVASYDLARVEMGWEPHYPELESIIESAWQWRREHPHC
jgi:UDP-glucose 4-epimerase